MKNKITRSELEAIGQNWLYRRNKLLEYAYNEVNPIFKRSKSLRLALAMNWRIGNCIKLLGQSKPKKDFAQGGFVPNTAHVDIGEYVIKTKKPTQ